MRSIVAVTYEMDDAKKAVSDLLSQIEKKGPLGKNGLGIVYCDVEVNHEEFIATLREKLPFDVVGCTSAATFDTENGTQIISIVLLVLTGDDVEFSSAVTGVLTAENLRQELGAAYERASSALREPCKLIFLIPSFMDFIPMDNYVDILSELSGDVPIFGGLPSSSVADGDILMYASGRPFNDRVAIALISGGVRPVFSIQNVLSTYSEQKRVVTKADKNIIYTVDDMPFVDYLRSVGMSVDELIAQGDLAVYVSTPLKVNLSKNNYNDGIPIVRTIKTLNPSDGSGALFGAISEKSTVSIATMKRQDIQDSCKMAIEEIREKIAAAGGGYTTLLCVSCCGRYMVMADDKDVEGRIIVENLPKGLTFSGFYAYGEFCPTATRDGKAVNRVHNESIIMCAL
ncbi:MAG: FIST C-terminal domain-containing protein [Synergistaceae bacterium]|jgi:hypothetical protein|nr:FIST C-terminal domain-containing protein [Synergistaceae bacterium]